MSEADSESNYLINMFATIYRLLPHPSIDYSVVFKTGIKNSKTYKILSYILEELLKKQKQQYVPTGEIFWEKLVIGSLNDEEIFKRCIRVISKINLEISLFCRIIAFALEYEDSFYVQREGLDILENFVKDKDKLELKLAEINKQKIPSLLNNFSKRGNNKLKERAAWLLDYILGPMTDMSSRIESL
jgi:hypothetical protein